VLDFWTAKPDRRVGDEEQKVGEKKTFVRKAIPGEVYGKRADVKGGGVPKRKKKNRKHSQRRKNRGRRGFILPRGKQPSGTWETSEEVHRGIVAETSKGEEGNVPNGKRKDERRMHIVAPSSSMPRRLGDTKRRGKKDSMKKTPKTEKVWLPKLRRRQSFAELGVAYSKTGRKRC